MGTGALIKGISYQPTYILEGTQAREATGEQVSTQGPGGFLYDGPMQVHRTENATPETLLIVRVLDKGKPESIRSERQLDDAAQPGNRGER